MDIVAFYFLFNDDSGQRGRGKDCTVTEVSSIPCVCIYPISDKHNNKGLTLRLLLPICSVSIALCQPIYTDSNVWAFTHLSEV